RNLKPATAANGVFVSAGAGGWASSVAIWALRASVSGPGARPSAAMGQVLEVASAICCWMRTDAISAPSASWAKHRATPPSLLMGPAVGDVGVSSPLETTQERSAGTERSALALPSPATLQSRPAGAGEAV